MNEREKRISSLNRQIERATKQLEEMPETDVCLTYKRRILYIKKTYLEGELEEICAKK